MSEKNASNRGVAALAFLSRGPVEDLPPTTPQDFAPPRRRILDHERMLSVASEAVEKHCSNAADEIERVGETVYASAGVFRDSCRTTAENLRRKGARERQRTSSVYAGVQRAVETVRALEKTFEDAEAEAEAEVRALAANGAAVVNAEAAIADALGVGANGEKLIQGIPPAPDGAMVRATQT